MWTVKTALARNQSNSHPALGSPPAEGPLLPSPPHPSLNPQPAPAKVRAPVVALGWLVSLGVSSPLCFSLPTQVQREPARLREHPGARGEGDHHRHVAGARAGRPPSSSHFASRCCDGHFCRDPLHRHPRCAAAPRPLHGTTTTSPSFPFPPAGRALRPRGLVSTPAWVPRRGVEVPPLLPGGHPTWLARLTSPVPGGADLLQTWRGPRWVPRTSPHPQPLSGELLMENPLSSPRFTVLFTTYTMHFNVRTNLLPCIYLPCEQ